MTDEVDPLSTYRATRDGRLLADPKYPRQGVIGDPGRQIEVSLHTVAGVDHVVITVLGGTTLAATGLSPLEAVVLSDLLRDTVTKITHR